MYLFIDCVSAVSKEQMGRGSQSVQRVDWQLAQTGKVSQLLSIKRGGLQAADAASVQQKHMELVGGKRIHYQYL